MRILPNGIAVIEGDTHISKWVIESNRLDHDQYALPIILEHICEGDWVVDAGAFIGDHTKAYLEAVGDSGSVFAFEPNPEARECLAHNCPDAEILPFGLSDLDVEVGMVENENRGASRLVEGQGIYLVKLDDYHLPQLDFLKLDVEGYELRALRGARKTIEVHMPTMWIEINEGALAWHHTTGKEVMDWVEALGYEVKAYPNDKADQYDILCLPCR